MTTSANRKKDFENAAFEGSKRHSWVISREIKERKFDPRKPQKFLGYMEVHRLLRWEKHPSQKTPGNSLDYLGLGDLAEWARDNGYPAVTGLVVTFANDDISKLNQPGGKFYTINKRRKDDIAWWMDEVRKAIAFDWDQFLDQEEVTSRPGRGHFSTSVHKTC